MKSQSLTTEDEKTRQTAFKGCSAILYGFASKCSMQGAPYISTSSWWLPRLLWCVLLATAVSFMGYHLYILIQKYLSYPTQNTILLGFSTLQFPAVTICNVNAVRKSQVWRFSQKFQEFVNLTDPQALENSISKSKPSTFSTNDENLSLDDIDFGLSKTDYSLRAYLNDSDRDFLEGFDNSWEKESKSSQFSEKDSKFIDTFATENV